MSQQKKYKTLSDILYPHHLSIVDEAVFREPPKPKKMPKPHPEYKFNEVKTKKVADKVNGGHIVTMTMHVPHGWHHINPELDRHE